MRNFNTIWRLLNSPVVIACIAFGLTTYLGSLYQKSHLQNQQKIEKSFQLRSHKLRQGQKSLNEITDSITTRLHLSRKYLELLANNYPQEILTERWDIYMKGVNDWNKKLILNRIKLEIFVCEDLAQELLYYGKKKNSTYKLLYYKEIKNKHIKQERPYCNKIKSRYITIKSPCYNEQMNKDAMPNLLYDENHKNKYSIQELSYYNELKNAIIVHAWHYCNEIENKDIIQKCPYCNEVLDRYTTLDWPYYNKKTNKDSVPDLLYFGKYNIRNSAYELIYYKEVINRDITLEWPYYKKLMTKNTRSDLLYQEKNKDKDSTQRLNYYNEIKNKLILLAWSYCNEIESKDIIQEWPYYSEMINGYITLSWPYYNAIPDLLYGCESTPLCLHDQFAAFHRKLLDLKKSQIDSPNSESVKKKLRVVTKLFDELNSRIHGYLKKISSLFIKKEYDLLNNDSVQKDTGTTKEIKTSKVF